MVVSDATPQNRALAPGRVLTGTAHLHAPAGKCIDCGFDAQGSTLTTWTFAGPTSTYAMCYWCAELWDTYGWLAPRGRVSG